MAVSGVKEVLPWNVMKSIILALIAVFTHVSCHVWVFFHYNTYHIRKALGIVKVLRKELP